MSNCHLVAGRSLIDLTASRLALRTPAPLKAQADALYVVGDALVNTNRTRIMTFSLGARLPTMFNARAFVQAGGLMSYGPNLSYQFRRTPSSSTRFCAVRSPAIFQLSSRPDSSLSSILRPPRCSASPSRSHLSCAPTR